MSDEQKAERRALIESNKAMRAANETCRAFVRGYLDRRGAPKGVLRYVVDTMLAQRWALARWSTGWPTRSSPRSVRRWASPAARSAIGDSGAHSGAGPEMEKAGLRPEGRNRPPTCLNHARARRDSNPQPSDP